MSVVVDGRSVPVVWSPSDLSGPDSDGHVGRQVAIQAAVHHRVVGTLESMTNVTFEPTADGRLLPGERRVSSTFGIGFWGDELRIVQYVALENTAFCNGQTDKDLAALLGPRPWALYTAVRKKAGHHVSANEFTYSIEHEDNAQLPSTDPRRGVVRDEIIEASIALDRLLLSGDGKAIRAAGIKCNDTAAAQLGKIVPGPTTIVDHHVAAPISKPFCWRRWANDPGFPQARFLAALTQETDMAGLTLSKLRAAPGWVTVLDIPGGAPGASDGVLAVQVDDPGPKGRFALKAGDRKPTIGTADVVKDPTGLLGQVGRREVRVLGGADEKGVEVEAAVILAGQVSFKEAEPDVVGEPDCTAAETAAVKAVLDDIAPAYAALGARLQEARPR